MIALADLGAEPACGVADRDLDVAAHGRADHGAFDVLVLAVDAELGATGGGLPLAASVADVAALVASDAARLRGLGRGTDVSSDGLVTRTAGQSPDHNRRPTNGDH